jgi:hypothetical protein
MDDLAINIRASPFKLIDDFAIPSYAAFWSASIPRLRLGMAQSSLVLDQ